MSNMAFSALWQDCLNVKITYFDFFCCNVIGGGRLVYQKLICHFYFLSQFFQIDFPSIVKSWGTLKHANSLGPPVSLYFNLLLFYASKFAFIPRLPSTYKLMTPQTLTLLGLGMFACRLARFFLVSH